jgi:membrane associated rhomboid family serine protease
MHDADAPKKPAPRHAFPWGPVRVVAAVFLVHLAIVLGLVGRDPDFMRFSRLGAVVAGKVTEQPWRLLTSMFVHADPAHVVWNGVSMLVFAVPVILDVGYLGAAIVYVAGGVVGGIAGAAAVPEGVVLFGSSGAVSALFGAWIAITLLRARRTGFPRRARMRTIGVSLLILPTLVNPETSSGQSISVAAHLGGLGAGIAAGLIAWVNGLVREVEPEDGDDEDDDDGDDDVEWVN